jgi:hypothetical protein
MKDPDVESPSPRQARRQLDPVLDERSDIGVARIIADWLLEPPSPFRTVRQAVSQHVFDLNQTGSAIHVPCVSLPRVSLPRVARRDPDQYDWRTWSDSLL